MSSITRAADAPSAVRFLHFGAPPERPESLRRGLEMSGRFDVRFVQKPWGHETIWAHTDRYVGKVLHIKAGHALSVQYHNRKDETIHLLSGEMIYRVQQDGVLTDMRLRAGESYRNEPGVIHQMEAVTDCDVLEASTPDLDDVVRLSDRYGREGTSAP
jgi:mannose-6-phosphate isomerase-like protein (cupin superfamily)